MSEQITIDELESYLWNSAVLLRTSIDAGSYKQYIFPLLFFKRICDVYDEETQAAEEKYGEDIADFDEDELHTFLVPLGFLWKDVREVSENVGAAIVNAFHAIEKANLEMLHGVFGDGAWTNKNRLPDSLLKDLIEHFSSKTLSIANCPEDELGQGYEYLIKKFADDSGHTAQEFYTNRFQHGVQDFSIANDDTLKSQAFISDGGLQQFDLVLANPPYSIKQWDRAAFESDKYGRIFLGTPPQERADYAFFQHILKSMDPATGRCAILFPHGVLFRDEEDAMREKLVKSDLIECVIGIGKNLF